MAAYKFISAYILLRVRQNCCNFNFNLADIPADAILELFGKIFFEYCQDAGYDKILQVLGATPRDFLQVRPYVW